MPVIPDIELKRLYCNVDGSEEVLFILIFKGALVARASADVNELDTLDIKCLYVSGVHRCKGFARMLMEYVAEFAREAGKNRLSLLVMDNNTVAQKFYKSVGFKEVY